MVDKDIFKINLSESVTHNTNYNNVFESRKIDEEHAVRRVKIITVVRYQLDVSRNNI